MQSDPNSTKEYLSELNRVISEEFWTQNLYDLVTPIRNFFLQNEEILSFKLARYCGASTELAFFCEWYYQLKSLETDSSRLEEENSKYFAKKVPTRLRGVRGLPDLLSHHIKTYFLPKQIWLLNRRLFEFFEKLKIEFPYLEKYISKEALSKTSVSDLIEIRPLYQEKVTISQYLDAQQNRKSYLKIGLPVLLGLQISLNQSSNPQLAKNVRWVLLEEILHGISGVLESGLSQDLQKFIYQNKLGERDEFDWWSLSSEKQRQIAFSSSDAREIAKESRQKLYQNIQNNLLICGLPEKYKTMLEDLLDWAHKQS